MTNSTTSRSSSITSNAIASVRLDLPLRDASEFEKRHTKGPLAESLVLFLCWRGKHDRFGKTVSPKDVVSPIRDGSSHTDTMVMAGARTRGARQHAYAPRAGSVAFSHGISLTRAPALPFFARQPLVLAAGARVEPRDCLPLRRRRLWRLLRPMLPFVLC